MENKTQIIKKRNLPKEVFLHLLAMVTLYWSAVSFITLLFQYVNYFIPDVLNRGYYISSYTGPLRFALSSLIIVFPVFIFVSWLLYKSYVEDTEKREFKLRKWLLYFTIFVSALVIIGDLVSTINTFLGGEITLRFVLKAFSILLVAALIFWYYIDDVRRDRPSEKARYFAIVVSVIVLVGIVGGFIISGSPMRERLIRFDAQKANDLQNIQSNIINYWQRKEVLPGNLNDLQDNISGYKNPVDPQTNSQYEYSVKGNTSFELCANFNLPNQDSQGKATMSIPPYGYDQNWTHGAGKVCFERTIDAQLYPPLNKTK